LEIQHKELAWQAFAKQENLNEDELAQFKLYYEQLVTYNDDVNLTRITQLDEVLAYHFRDSLSVCHALPFNEIQSIADIGSGAGFPSIPLKIKYPHLRVTIIEVSGKRIAFLQRIVDMLGLQHVTLCQQDWRTFLRQHTNPVDYFFARASLAIPELLRVFKPSSHYRLSTLVYWASDQWQPAEDEIPFMQKSFPYTVGIKQRKLVFFVNPH